MTVQWENRDLPLGQGMDDSSAKTALPPGRLLKLINGQFTNRGGLTKRKGFDTYLGTAGGGGPILPYADRLLLQSLTDFSIYDYSPNDFAWWSRGTLRSVPTSTQVVKSINGDLTAFDCCSAGNFTALAWLSNSTIQVQITDDTTGAVVNTHSLTSFGGATPASGFQILGYKNNVGTVMFFLAFAGSIQSVTRGGAGTWTWSSIVSPGQHGDGTATRVALDTTNNRLWLATYNSLGDTVQCCALSNSLVVNGTGYEYNGTGNVDTTCPLSIAWFSSQNIVVVVTRDFGGNMDFGTFGPANAAFGSTVIVANKPEWKHITLVANGAKLSAIYDKLSDYGTYKAKVYQYDYAGGSVDATILNGASLASDAIVSGGKTYFAAAYYSKVTPSMSTAVQNAVTSTGQTSPLVPTLNSATFVVSMEDSNVCARVLRASTLAMDTICSASATATGLLFGARTLSEAESPNIFTALSLGAAATVRFDLSSERARGVSAFHDLLTVGGCPMTFDGTAPVEAGFHVYPEITYSASPGAGGIFNQGTSKEVGTGNYTKLWSKRSTTYATGDIADQLGLEATDSAAANVWMCILGGTTAGVKPAGYSAPSANYGSNVAVGTVVQDGTSWWQCLGPNLPQTWASGLSVVCGNMFVPTTPNGFMYAVVSYTGAPNTPITIPAGEPKWGTTIGGTTLKNGITYVCVSATYGQLTAAKSYTYGAIYSWVDDRGQLVRSAMSPLAGFTMTTSSNGLTNNPALAISAYRMTGRSNVVVEVYRTSGDGTTCQQIAKLANYTSGNVIGFIDTIPDSTQANGVVAYQGVVGAGELENRPPPTCSTVEAYGQRVWTNDLERPFALHPSKLVVDGFGVSWSDELEIDMNGAFGSVNALKQMDGKLYFFQDRAIGYIVGDGPDNTGNGVAFAQPTYLPTDVGCTNPDSVVLTPIGIVFQSPKGIYLVDRNNTVSFIGEPIRNDLVDTVIATVLDPTTHQVLFLQSSSAGGSTIAPGQTAPAQTGSDAGYTPVAGSAFVYDWENGAWSNWNVNTAGAQNGLGAWSGCLVCSDNTGVVSLQTGAGNTFVDRAGAFSFYCEIAPVRLSEAVAGYGRARKCNLQFYTSNISGGASAITVTPHYNYDNSAEVQNVSGVALPAVVLQVGHNDIEVMFRQQKAKSIGLEINESTSGWDLTLEGITFQVGVKGGLNPKASGRRAG